MTCFVKKNCFGTKSLEETGSSMGIEINNRCFHTLTAVQRKRNRIRGLFLDSGEWCTDDKLLQEEALKYYKTLFSSGAADWVPRDLGIDSFPKLSMEGNQDLTKEVTKREVYEAA
jgi:hypothetical protein